MAMPLPDKEGEWPEQQEWFTKVLERMFQEQEHVIQHMLNRALGNQYPSNLPTDDCDDLPDIPVERLPDLQEIREPKEREKDEKAESEILELEAHAVDAVDATAAKEKAETELIPITAALRAMTMDLILQEGKKAALGVNFMAELREEGSHRTNFVIGILDGVMAVLVCIHLALMIAMSEVEVETSRFYLGLSEMPSDRWQNYFETAELFFFFVYLLDVLLRVCLLRSKWPYDPQQGTVMFMNLFDAFLVLVNVVELMLMSGSNAQESPSTSIRVVKLLRVVRTLRIVKTFAAFRQLRILVASCIASIGALLWSMVLLLLLKLSFALLISEQLQGFIQDETADLEARKELFYLYGSFSRALYTMYEITYSGGWFVRVRPAVDKVSGWYAIPFLTYITLVVFAVLRVVTALFIKETLESTANDADLAIEIQRHAGSKLSRKLEVLFNAFDRNGNGTLSREEWELAMSLPSVSQYMQALDIRMLNCESLFDVLDDGDNEVTISEFCKGLKQVKGQARALDVVFLQHATEKVFKECKAIRKQLENSNSQHFSRHSIDVASHIRSI